MATPITLPSHPNTKITKVSVYMAGRLGSVAVRNCVWNTSGTILGYSAEYTAADGGATAVGASDHYDKALTTPLAVASGATIWAGWAHSGSGGHQWDRDDGSGHTTELGQNSSDTGSMTSIGTKTTEKPNVYVTYQYTVDTSLEGTIGTIIGIARQGANLWVLDDLGTLFQYNQADLSYVGKTTAIAAYITARRPAPGCSTTGRASSSPRPRAPPHRPGAAGQVHHRRRLLVNAQLLGARGQRLDRHDPRRVPGQRRAQRERADVLAGDRGRLRRRLRVRRVLRRKHGEPRLRPRGGGGRGSGMGRLGLPGLGGRLSDVGLEVHLLGLVVGQPAVLARLLLVRRRGTVHETRVGPRASVSLGRRRQLGVTLPAVPAGGADDPDKLNLYMGSGAIDPDASAYGSLWLQATTTATQITLTSYTSSGAQTQRRTTSRAGPQQ